MDYLRLGDYHALCDRCKKKYYASELRDDGQYPGLKVCKSCYDPKHPQEFLKGQKEDISVPWSRPDPEYDTNVTTVDGETLSTLGCATPNSIPGIAIPGCAVPGWSKGYTNPL